MYPFLSLQGFTKGKFCLTNVTGLSHNEVSESVEEWRAVDVVYLNYNKALDTNDYRPLLTTLER